MFLHKYELCSGIIRADITEELVKKLEKFDSYIIN